MDRLWSEWHERVEGAGHVVECMVCDGRRLLGCEYARVIEADGLVSDLGSQNEDKKDSWRMKQERSNGDGRCGETKSLRGIFAGVVGIVP